MCRRVLTRLRAQARADADLISRATTQNKELKTRLVELEDRFVAVSNDRADLTHQLHAAQHRLKHTPPAGHVPPGAEDRVADDSGSPDTTPTVVPEQPSAPESNTSGDAAPGQWPQRPSLDVAPHTGTPQGQDLVDSLYL